MKKLLLLLLFTVSIYGQQEQDFDYGIKNTASQLDDNAPFLTVQDSTGVLKKSSSSVWAKKLYVTNLPKPTLQQVTTAGNTTTNPIVVTTADFAGIAIQGTSNDNIGVLGTSNTGIGGAFSTVSGTKIASFSLAATEKAFIASDGTITASEGILPNNVIVKSQFDTKVSGSGTINYLPKFTATGTVGNSQIFDNGNVGIGTVTPYYNLDVVGDIRATGYVVANDAFVGNSFVSVGNQDFYFNKTTPYSIVFNTNGVERMRMNGAGNLLIGTTTDNGVDKLQVNGTISALPATLSNQVVVKSQLDLKSNDTEVIHKTGNETKTGSLNVEAAGDAIFGDSINGSGIRGYSVTGFAGEFFSSYGTGVFAGSDTGLAGTFNTNFGSKIVSFKANSAEKAFIASDGTITGASFVSNGTIRLKNYTVATLPTGVQGDTAYVTDATAPTYLGTLTGGGAVVCPVFFNGTIWVSH